MFVQPPLSISIILFLHFTACDTHTHDSSDPHPIPRSQPDDTKAHRHTQPGGAQRPGGARAVCQDLQTETHQTGLHAGKPGFTGHTVCVVCC